MAKPKQKEQLPLDIPERVPPWKISAADIRLGKYWIPKIRKQQENHEHSTGTED